MKTTFIFKLFVDDESLIEPMTEALENEAYDELYDNPSEADIVVTALMDGDTSYSELLEMIREAVAEIDDDPTIDVIRVWDDNADEWKEFFGLDKYDSDVIEAVLGERRDLLKDPEDIGRYIDDHYIGYFRTEDDMACHLAEDDPEIQKLDGKIVDCMDLAEYYADEMRFDMWETDGHWFWN